MCQPCYSIFTECRIVLQGQHLSKLTNMDHESAYTLPQPLPVFTPNTAIYYYSIQNLTLILCHMPISWLFYDIFYHINIAWWRHTKCSYLWYHKLSQPQKSHGYTTEWDYEISLDRLYPTTAVESIHNFNHKHYHDAKSPTVSEWSIQLLQGRSQRGGTWVNVPPSWIEKNSPWITDKWLLCKLCYGIALVKPKENVQYPTHRTSLGTFGPSIVVSPLPYQNVGYAPELLHH